MRKSIVFSAAGFALAAVILAATLAKVVHAAGASGYHLIKTVPVPGAPSWIISLSIVTPAGCTFRTAPMWW